MTRFIANSLYIEDYSDVSETNEDVNDFLETSPNEQMKEDTRFIEEIKELLKTMKSKRNRKGLKEIRLVYFVDVGGQPQFQEILPNFIRCDINLLVHKLSEGLHHCPKFNYEVCKNKYKAPEHMKASNIDIMKQSVRSICSNMSFESNCKPHVAIIGMFKDMCSQDSHKFSKMVKEKSKEIVHALRDYCGPSGIGKCELIPSPQGHIFAIDGSKEGWGENDKAIETLKEAIHQYAEKKPVSVPIRYFIFLQALKDYSEERGFSYLTMSQCDSVAVSCNVFMKKSDVKKALILFDECNIILYFADILPGVVFIKPAFLYNLTTALIVESFSCENLTYNSDNVHFRRHGVFTDALLRNVLARDKMKFKNGFIMEDFLKLLQSLLIIAEVSPRQYFMPCVLPLWDSSSSQLDAITQQMEKNNIDGPLLISFTHRMSSRGLFCALLASLASTNWIVSKQAEGRFCFRNIIQFKLRNERDDPIGDVVIMDKTSHLEVYTTCTRSSCFYVQNTIRVSLVNVCKTMKYCHNKVESRGLRCQRCPDMHSTEVFFDKNASTLRERCSKTRKLFPRPLAPRRAVWFTDVESQGKLGFFCFFYKTVHSNTIQLLL
jgi:hypothetical protein